jgi:hypothetical protein
MSGQLHAPAIFPPEGGWGEGDPISRAGLKDIGVTILDLVGIRTPTPRSSSPVASHYTDCATVARAVITQSRAPKRFREDQ